MTEKFALLLIVKTYGCYKNRKLQVFVIVSQKTPTHIASIFQKYFLISDCFSHQTTLAPNLNKCEFNRPELNLLWRNLKTTFIIISSELIIIWARSMTKPIINDTVTESEKFFLH